MPISVQACFVAFSQIARVNAATERDGSPAGKSFALCQYVRIDKFAAFIYSARMRATAKSAQLQIRVAPAEKAAIRRAARRSGLDMSAYVLARVLPAPARRFRDLTEACVDSAGARLALAELNSWLASLGSGELPDAVATPPPALTPFLANYVAAMVEFACARHGVAPPAWTDAIAPLTDPMFGSALSSLRLYLLTHSPAPFRRRNIFIDSSVGSRV